MDEFLQYVVIGFLIFLTLLYQLNSAFKFYTKMALYYTIIFLTTFLAIFPSLLRPGDVGNSRYVQWIFGIMNQIFNIKLEIKGRENLQLAKPFIIVCNHQSSLDLIPLFYIWPDPCTCMAKRELLYAGPFGICGLLCGLTFVDRMHSSKAHDTVDKTIKKLKEKNICLWVFPEGTRNHGDEMLNFKKGAFHIAIQAQVPIVPIVFSPYSDFYNTKEKKFNTGTITISILPKISTEGLTKDVVPELAEQVRKVMIDSFNEMKTQKVLESNGTQ